MSKKLYKKNSDRHFFDCQSLYYLFFKYSLCKIIAVKFLQVVDTFTDADKFNRNILFLCY